MITKLVGIISALFVGKIVFSIVAGIAFFFIFGAVLNKVECSPTSGMAFICRLKNVIKYGMNKGYEVFKYLANNVLKLLNLDLKTPNTDTKADNYEYKYKLAYQYCYINNNNKNI